MNVALRRVAVAVMVMVVALLANATYVQVITADSLRADPRNSRVLLDEYSRQRGQISAGDQVLAISEASDDRYKFVRRYPSDPEAFAPATGIYSLQYGSSGLERAEDPVLNGSDNRLFGRRFFDLVSGRDPRGGNVVTTLNPAMQQVAYEQLTAKGYSGSVVAIEPSTGKILTMVSTPSFDPGTLSSHDLPAVAKQWDDLNSDPSQPMLNRAVNQTYEPGSTFKVVVTAAALAKGVKPDKQVTADPVKTYEGVPLENYARERCGPGPTVTLLEAFAKSCNTAFADLGIEVGASALTSQAADFGIGSNAPSIPIQVADSRVGSIDGDSAIAQSSIGQLNVSLTPLQNAIIAATVANGGIRMQPHLVAQLQGPDLSTLSTIAPQTVQQAMEPDVAATLTDMMIEAEKYAGGANAIPGVQIASKTGTAEHGSDPRNTPPNTWYIAFAPAANPTIAVAVIVEDGGNSGLSATGASVSAPIGRAVIKAGLQGR